MTWRELREWNKTTKTFFHFNSLINYQSNSWTSSPSLWEWISQILYCQLATAQKWWTFPGQLLLAAAALASPVRSTSRHVGHRRALAVEIAAAKVIRTSSDDVAAAAASTPNCIPGRLLKGAQQNRSMAWSRSTNWLRLLGRGGTQAAATELINSSLLRLSPFCH